MGKTITEDYFWRSLQYHPSGRVLKETLSEYPQYPLEINSGAIGPSDIHSELFDVQANTAEGMWDFHAIPKSHFSEDEFLEFWQWKNQRAISVIPRNIVSLPVAPASATTIENRVEDTEEISDDWRTSPTELLAKLQDSSICHEELCDAILFAEIAKFDEPQTKQLLLQLFTFVNKYRFWTDESVMTAVGAAIRKLAMNLPDSQLEQYADLFVPTDTETLPCEIELELAKAILWRLTVPSASLSHKSPELESQLAELATDYLIPRLILQENYASVALQASLGALLLNGENAARVLQGVKDIEIDWFAELFQRRLELLRREIEDDGSNASIAVVESLKNFESTFQSM